MAEHLRMLHFEHPGQPYAMEGRRSASHLDGSKELKCVARQNSRRVEFALVLFTRIRILQKSPLDRCFTYLPFYYQILNLNGIIGIDRFAWQETSNASSATVA